MEKVLLIQLGRMGDLVQTLPLVRRLKEESLDREVTLVCLNEFQAVLRDLTAHDRLLCPDLKDVRQLCEKTNRQQFRSLKPFSDRPEYFESYDLVVNLTHDEGSAALCEKIASRRKAGRIHTYPGEIRLLGDGAKYLFALVRNRVQNLFNLVDLYLGMGGVHPGRLEGCFRANSEAKSEALALLQNAGYRQKGKLIALQMGASEFHRTWPVERFAALAAQLLQTEGIEILLVGDQREVAFGERFSQCVKPPVINLIGKTQLHQLPALLQFCDLLVSNDTGTIHLAAAVNIPTLGLYFSTTYYTETAPYGEGHTVLQVEIECAPCTPANLCADQRCKGFLPVEAVLAAVRSILRGDRFFSLEFPNLFAYRSRFLANGTLIYTPLSPDRVSSHYLRGFISRMMWERALGIEKDPVFIEEFFAHLPAMTQCHEIVANYRRVLSGLREKFSEGLQHAREMTPALRLKPAEGLSGLSEKLTQTVRQISELDRESGLFRDFFNYEIMDLDYLAPPNLALELERKFSKLEKLSGTFLRVLQDVEARLRIDSVLAGIPTAISCERKDSQIC